MVENYMISEAQWLICNIFPLVLISLLTIGLIILIVAFFLRKRYQRDFHQQLARNEIEHSLRLIEVLYSERHEYRNCLQVIKSMAALGAVEKVDKYLSNVIIQITNSSGFTKIDDPVLAASIVSHQAKAKEHNILIKVNCPTSLKGISNISIRLGRIFNLFFDVLIERMTSLQGSGNEILVNIEERAEEYFFDFKVDRFFDGSTVSLSSAFCDKPSIRTVRTGCSQQMDEIKKIVKELRGSFYFVVKGNYILRLKLTVSKRGENNLFRNNKAISF